MGNQPSQGTADATVQTTGSSSAGNVSHSSSSTSQDIVKVHESVERDFELLNTAGKLKKEGGMVITKGQNVNRGSRNSRTSDAEIHIFALKDVPQNIEFLTEEGNVIQRINDDEVILSGEFLKINDWRYKKSIIILFFFF